MKVRFSLVILAVLLASFLVTPVSSYAGPDPAESLKQTIGGIQSTLKNSNMSDDAKRSAVRRLVFDRLDFDGICKRALGRHYAANAARFDEFCGTFIGLIEKNWLGKVGAVGGFQIVYVKQKIDGDLATLDTKFITVNGTEIPVSYRMRLASGSWKVFDVVVEGVSMISNYRTQFNRIISGESFDELLRLLREKSLGG